MRTDGSELRQITHTPGEVNTFPRWSADGAFLYFFRQRPTVSFLKVPVTSGATIEVGPWPFWSRARTDSEDKKVVFERREGDIMPATVVRELATGRETTLPVILRYPRWTQDGHTIIGTEEMPGANSPIRQRIVACAIGGPCHALAEGAQGVPSGDDSRVFFLRSSERGAATRELWSVDRDGRNARQSGSLGPFRVGAVHYDVSARDQIVWTMVQPGENRIGLTEFR